MDMNRSLPLPSGSEVESAVWHVEVLEVPELPVPVTQETGIKGRLHTLQHRVMDQVGSMKTMANERVRSLRSGVNSRVTQVRGDVRTNPAKWAGIAAGAGMAVGLVGRYLKWRAERPVAQLVVIDAC